MSAIRRSVACMLLAAASSYSVLAAPPVAAQAREAAPSMRLEAEIRRTAYGVPHVLAKDYVAAGYGLGYAFAEDNACEMARYWVQLEASLAATFGPEEGNLASDFFWKRILDEDVVGKLLARPPPHGPLPEVRELIKGYAAGYNRYLEEVGGKLSDPRCRDATWIRPVTERDLYMHALSWSLRAYVQPLIPHLVAAAPPAEGGAKGVRVTALAAAAADRPSSNMVALGRLATDNGRGMLFANPHWTWTGPFRFYEAHLRIPGRLNAAGMTFMALPIVVMGHNERVAWSHTVSTAATLTAYKLRLVPGSPTSYVFDGKAHAMTSRTVRVRVRLDDGTPGFLEHTFWESGFGPMIQTEQQKWTGDSAYALRLKDMNIRLLNQDFLNAKARSAADVHEAAASTLGWGWFNSAAADADGRSYYGEVQSVPNLTDAQLKDCALTERMVTIEIPILDGTRSQCQWGSDPDAVEPGLLGVRRLPHVFRDDYVANSNDSYWATNLHQPLEGFASILGPERTELSLRTRNGLYKIEGRLRGTDGLPGRRFSLEQLIRVTMNNEVYGGVLWRSDLVGLCRSMPAAAQVAEACPVLASWDLTENLESAGALLFRRFEERSAGVANRFSTPFDPGDPLSTPRGLAVTDPAVGEAFIAAVRDFRASGIALDAPVGAHQFVTRRGERIGIHGGPESTGQYNLIKSDGWTPGVGWPNVKSGSGFILFVQFTPKGPVARSILAYSQSTDAGSAHFDDQTRLFSRNGLKEARFTERQVLADPALRRIRLCARASAGASGGLVTARCDPS